MLWIMILGIAMALLSGIAWVTEATAGFIAIRDIPTYTWSDRMCYPVRFIGALPKFIPLAIDLTATIWLVGAFGLGGVIGAAMGLTISNVISGFLITLTKTKKAARHG